MDTGTNGSNNIKEEKSCVDINAALEGVSNFNFFSSNLKQIRELRKKKKKKRLDPDDEEKLMVHYGLIATLAANVDKKTFREKIPDSEIQDWLDYIIEEIKSLTEKRHWINTGRLNPNDYRVLQFCAEMVNDGHVVPVYLAFESEFFQVLANFIKARKGCGGRALPHVTICGLIGQIVLCSLDTANLHFDKPWSLEKIFKKFEASGILEQILRCATVPEPARLGPEFCWGSQDFVNELLLEKLMYCPSILTRKFKSGESCGDTLKAILDGRDGSRSMEPRILNKFQAIAKTMDPLELEAVVFGKIEALDFCFNCQKDGVAEARMSVCAGCRSVSYCSKKCQKADWKVHKHSCRKFNKAEKDRATTVTMSILNFMNQNCETVFQALIEKCNSTGASMSDLAVEVDLMPKNNGIIPALYDPPMFRIVLTRDYISGQEIPEWVPRTNKNAGRQFKDHVKQEMTSSTSTSFALVVMHGGRQHVFPDYGIC